MKRLTGILFFIFATSTLALASGNGATPVLLSEIEIDPPSTTSDACQYTELRGTPNATIPANTYFLSLNSDSGNFGFANQAVNIGGQVLGANGTITLFNSSFGPCTNRAYGSGSNFFSYTNPLRVGGGSETYLVVQATGAIATGQDLDTNDDGVFNAGLGITVLDGFALLINPKEEFVYGAAAGVINISNTITVDQPDAVTRFTGNTTPFLISSFYFGELAAAPDETNAYSAPLSPNFPMGGVLTPGDGAGPGGISTARADFDGDGRSDVSVVRGGSTWYLLRSTAGFTGINFGASGDVAVPGDYDGDGKTDLAVVRGGNTWYLLRSTAGFTGVGFGLTGDIPVAGDYDGDGKFDVAVFRPSANAWYVQRSIDGVITTTVFGTAGDIPVAGDFDGDGKWDQTVFRPSQGNWITNKSTGGMSTTNWGLSGDVLVPGDYDGDNKFDQAVFRSGNWYILKSTGGVISQNWGIAGDVPAPADYDGDNKEDIAVFRSGNWYILQSTAGVLNQPFGIAGDVAVPSRYLP